MTEKPVRESHCRCCGGFCGHGTDPEYCGACIRAGEPPDDWEPPAMRGPSAEKAAVEWGRPNLMKLRGYEFEEIVPWQDIIERMARGEK